MPMPPYSSLASGRDGVWNESRGETDVKPPSRVAVACAESRCASRRHSCVPRFRARLFRSAVFLIGALVLLPVAGGQDTAQKGLPTPPKKDFTDQTACPVLDVPAGNALVVRLEGEETTIRLIGAYVPRSGSEADQARPFLRRLLMGESVYVEHEPDWPVRDRQERVWAYAYRAPDGLFVNLELIRLGYARISAASPFEHHELFRAYERLARKSKKGLWRPRAGVRTETQPTSSPVAQEASESSAKRQGTAQDVTVYVTERGRRYHRKDCQYVRGGAIAMTLKEAKAKAYTPCLRCKPPE